MHSLDGAPPIGEPAPTSRQRCTVAAQVAGDERDSAPCSSPQDSVAAFLNERVAASPNCPRCGSARVQRWGKIAGVQRLRCRACTRTFNPLTGTPLARLRRRDLWFGHARLLEAGLSLRRGARAIGVHYNTALRWRHRWLERPRQQMARRFTGLVAAEIVTFEPCAQQPRGWTRVALPEQPDLVAADREPGTPARLIPVLLLRDQCGARADAVLSSVALTELPPILDRLVDPATNGLCSDSHAAARTYGATRGIADRCDASSRRNQRRLAACRWRLQAWMRRFVGVSTHRLANYLGWRRLLDRPGHCPAPAGWLDRALGADQHPTVTAGDAAAGSGDGGIAGLSDERRVGATDLVPKSSASTGEAAGAAGGGSNEATYGDARRCCRRRGGEGGDRLTGACRPA